MSRVSPGQYNFSGGEFSPLLAGRVDAERYASGLDTCLGFIPLLQGPVLRCPGTRFRGYTADVGNVTGRLQRFQFSTTQSYMLVFTNNKLQIYYASGEPVLEASQAITGVTQANPGVVTYSGADNYANGDEVILDGIVGMTELNGRRFIVANVDTGANTFELTDQGGSNVDTSGYTAYSSDGTVEEVYTVTTTYTTAELFQLVMVQSADVLYITHPDHKPAKLTRTGNTAWTLTDITFTDGPYDLLNSGDTTITPSATTGAGITLTASAVTGINSDQGFLSTDVGRFVRLRHTATWGYALITAWTSSTVVTATVINDFGATTATAFWRLGVWSDTTGYPAVCQFHDDRLWYGGADGFPQRIDGSRVADYDAFAPTETDAVVLDDNAVGVTLQSQDVQRVRWIASSNEGLLVGTVSSEFLVAPSEVGASIVPGDVTAKPVTYHGSTTIQTIQADNATIFVQRAGRKIREVNANLTASGFIAPDLTQIAEHITESGITQLAFQQEPHSLVWATRTDGVLVSITYERDAQGGLKAAAARRVLGGTSNVGGSAAEAISVQSLPNEDGTKDILWVLVKRYVNGNTYFCVETIEFEDQNSAEQEDFMYLDSAIIYDSSSSDTITGLWHLEGETVAVLSDGFVQPDVTVSGGQVTLEQAASVVHLGYNFNSRIKLLRPEAGSQIGTAIGKTRRVHRVAIQLLRSMGMSIGENFTDMKDLIFRTSGNATNTAVPLFTGLKDGPVTFHYDLNNQICIEQSQPFPANILGISWTMHTNDR